VAGVVDLERAGWRWSTTSRRRAERGYARELLSRADADGDPDLRLEVIRAISVRGIVVRRAS
jgi:hypothetical protein